MEPSAGCGTFLDLLPSDTLSYDLDPHDDRIIKQDYLTLELEYKKGRCIIGNPPFGMALNTARKFYNKATEQGDFVAFILPISQFENSVFMSRFPLIYSEDLGTHEYSGSMVNCVFNIYSRHGKPKVIPKNIEGINIKKYDRGTTKDMPPSHDIAICCWGSIGKELEYYDQYAQTLYFYISHPLKDRIIKTLKETDWVSHPLCANRHINIWKAIQVLCEQIPELLEPPKVIPKKIEGIEIKRYMRGKRYKNKKSDWEGYDFSIIAWGKGTIGMETFEYDSHVNTIYFKITHPLKDKIKETILNHNWDAICPSGFINNYNVIQVLCEQIPELLEPPIEEEPDMFGWLK